ncbi:MAG TPA: HNH endonuclease [Verrucomicrobiae bacterium]
MSDYIAYHSVEKWGEYSPDENLNFYSGKSEAFLRKSIGCNVWVIVGKPAQKRTVYFLAGKYTSEKIRPRPIGGFDVIGLGKSFLPMIELSKLKWFSRLKAEQGNFSHGFNQIHDAQALKKLSEIAENENAVLETEDFRVEDYIKALKNLPEWCREILVIQFQQPRHEFSAGELARVKGYRNFSKANLSYGRTAHLVCDALEASKPPSGQWQSTISEGYHNGDVWIWVMRPNLVEAIRQLGWAREPQYQTFFLNPEEQATTEEFVEGNAQLIAVNIFERNQKARTACLRHHGFVCSACNFDFEKNYGELGREFIHVHHIKPLAEIGEEYTVDPINDLLPVCPNCHAMLHRKTPALTVFELKELIANLRASAALR